MNYRDAEQAIAAQLKQEQAAKDAEMFSMGMTHKIVLKTPDGSLVVYARSLPTRKEADKLARKAHATDYEVKSLHPSQAEPAKAPSTPPQKDSGEPQEDEDGGEQCYLVICSRDDEPIEILAVVAEASRFARRAARKEWQNTFGSADGIEFNARYAGPNWTN